jgi:hypothetical protein
MRIQLATHEQYSPFEFHLLDWDRLTRMDVGNSVRKSIDDWKSGDLDAAMLHACNAVDGTARKAYQH